MSEPDTFNRWWESTGTNSVILRAQALSAWMARAGLEQQPQPAEDPDEWVEITDSTHVLREDIDWTTTKTGWEPISIWDGETVGQICVDYSGEKIKFRCRRRDLPRA